MSSSETRDFLAFLISCVIAALLLAGAVSWIRADTARLVESGQWHIVNQYYWVDENDKFMCYTQYYLNTRTAE